LSTAIYDNLLPLSARSEPLKLQLHQLNDEWLLSISIGQNNGGDVPGSDFTGENGTVSAEAFVSLPWTHKNTAISNVGETLAYNGFTVWTAEHAGQTFRLQWDWLYEPYFQRPFTMDVQPRSNAIFASGDCVHHSLPMDERVQTLRSAIDRIDWEQTVLDALLAQDQDLKRKIDRFLQGLGESENDDD